MWLAPVFESLVHSVFNPIFIGGKYATLVLEGY